MALNNGNLNLSRVLMSSKRVGVVKGSPRFNSRRAERHLSRGREVPGPDPPDGREARALRRWPRAMGGSVIETCTTGRARLSFGSFRGRSIALSFADCASLRNLSRSVMRLPDCLGVLRKPPCQVIDGETMSAYEQNQPRYATV